MATTMVAVRVEDLERARCFELPRRAIALEVEIGAALLVAVAEEELAVLFERHPMEVTVARVRVDRAAHAIAGHAPPIGPRRRNRDMSHFPSKPDFLNSAVST
jgi:hypothetical protein